MKYVITLETRDVQTALKIKEKALNDIHISKVQYKEEKEDVYVLCV